MSSRKGKSKKAKEVDPRMVFRSNLDDLLKRRFYYANGYSIYRGVAGLFDYGPPGAALNSNILDYWRRFFIIEEDMLEVSCTSLTPSPVLEASGHVAKFEDFMVRDEVTGDCFRADHLLEDHLDKLASNPKATPEELEEYKLVRAQADAYSLAELGEKLKAYNVKAPETHNPISAPYAFNLMFKTEIGPTGKVHGYLRPETAQGIFVNFKKLLEYNGGVLPFASAQIGPAFRNEIAPRAGLLRVREFTLAEIEHFVDPKNKDHPKFKKVADEVVTLFPKTNQTSDGLTVDMTIGDAVSKGVIDNETLGYFIARVQQFLVKIGIKREKLRFRQHLSDEMAHYANDCWDAEIETTYGWIEAVGNADRGCWDLSQHSKHSGEALTAFVPYPDGERTVSYIKQTVKNAVIGRTLKGNAKKVIVYLDSIANDEEKKAELQKEMEEKKQVTIEGEVITSEMLSFSQDSRVERGEHIVPGVIEPSFGIGRILYCLLEHAYFTRETETDRKDEKPRAVLGLKPIVAPIKCSILPLLDKQEFYPVMDRVVSLFNMYGISSKVDKTGVAIGRRYWRMDEGGVPFGITIDFQTLEDDTVTLRERDSMEQVRMPVDDLVKNLTELIEDRITWDDIKKVYPVFTSSSGSDE